MFRRLLFATTTQSTVAAAVPVAVAAFLIGVIAGVLSRPIAPAASTGVAAVLAPATASPQAPQVATAVAPPGVEPGALLGYPADVVRIIDGDTFQARVQVWPGLSIDTKVRLRGIDAPELHARCDEELAKAQAARAALTEILAEGGVAISQVGIDKYGGRVDAAVATRTTADVSAALLNGGFARSYGGGRRAGWC